VVDPYNLCKKSGWGGEETWESFEWWNISSGIKEEKGEDNGTIIPAGTGSKKEKRFSEL